MQQQPIFKTTCRGGTLFVDQMNISIVAPFNKLVWSIPRNSITNIIQKPSFLSTEVEIYYAYGVYVVQTLPKQKASELVALLATSQQMQSQQPQKMSFQAPPVQTAPTGIPIDIEIQRVKQEIEQRRFQLSQINANMANIRSHYQQAHLHGGGKLVGAMRDMQRSGKDAKLRKQQPQKERLQREKQALEQQLNQLKSHKALGVTHIPSQ